MRRWNLPQVNTKVMCAVLTAAMVMTGFTACGGTTSAGTESAASESAEQEETIAPEGTTEQSTVEQSTETESGEEKVESYLGQITAIDGNVISIALAEKPETPDGETPTGEKSDGQAPDGNGGAPNGEAPTGGQIVLRDAVIICAARQFFHQFFLFRQEFQLLLFVDTDQEFLHILFVALISGQDPVTVIEMGIVPLEQPQKFRIIEQPHSFLPVALRQVGKMEQIPDSPDGRIQHPMLHPVVCTDISVTLDDSNSISDLVTNCWFCLI